MNLPFFKGGRKGIILSQKMPMPLRDFFQFFSAVKSSLRCLILRLGKCLILRYFLWNGSILEIKKRGRNSTLVFLLSIQ